MISFGSEISSLNPKLVETIVAAASLLKQKSYLEGQRKEFGLSC